VKWADGETSHPYRVFANQFVIVNREKPGAAYWYPERAAGHNFLIAKKWDIFLFAVELPMT
jgi:hypothetical protein